MPLTRPNSFTWLCVLPAESFEWHPEKVLNDFSFFIKTSVLRPLTRSALERPLNYLSAWMQGLHTAGNVCCNFFLWHKNWWIFSSHYLHQTQPVLIRRTPRRVHAHLFLVPSAFTATTDICGKLNMVMLFFHPLCNKNLLWNASLWEAEQNKGENKHARWSYLAFIASQLLQAVWISFA